MEEKRGRPAKLYHGETIKNIMKTKKGSYKAVRSQLAKGIKPKDIDVSPQQIHYIQGVTIKKYAKDNGLSFWKIYRKIKEKNRQKDVIKNHDQYRS